MGKLRVSDHALVRFLERAGNLDVESVRVSLESGLARAAAAARAIGTSDYLIRMNGHTFIVRSETVVTVLLDDDNAGARAHALGKPEFLK